MKRRTLMTIGVVIWCLVALATALLVAAMRPHIVQGHVQFQGPEKPYDDIDSLSDDAHPND